MNPIDSYLLQEDPHTICMIPLYNITVGLLFIVVTIIVVMLLSKVIKRDTEVTS